MNATLERKGRTEFIGKLIGKGFVSPMLRGYNRRSKRYNLIEDIHPEAEKIFKSREDFAVGLNHLASNSWIYRKGWLQFPAEGLTVLRRISELSNRSATIVAQTNPIKEWKVKGANKFKILNKFQEKLNNFQVNVIMPIRRVAFQKSGIIGVDNRENSPNTSENFRNIKSTSIDKKPLVIFVSNPRTEKNSFIYHSDKEKEKKLGGAKIVARTKGVIIPTYVMGFEKWPGFFKDRHLPAIIVFGKPIRRDQLQSVNLHQAFLDLKDHAHDIAVKRNFRGSK